ncbi:N-acetylglucosaminidase [Salinicoccus sp. HZC-1]|uniref:N-acetylglucosaminidase n=1 Tax=Salinicoccus sp. HZC-1 TaxID=3385497 RepID=UPI00398A6BBB
MKEKTKQDLPVLVLLGIMVIFFITFLVAETTLFEKAKEDEDIYIHSFEEAVEIQINNNTLDLKIENGSALEAEDENIRKAMDISQSSTDFQFLKLDETVNLTAEQLNESLKGKGILEGHGKTFLKAQNKYNLNALYLISHAQIETGNGKSALAQGIKVEDGTYYNFFGIGAFDKKAVSEGSSYAAKSDWSSPEKAIMGGAKFIRENYVSKGQDTLYAMRWNPENPGSHLYATDIDWSKKIGRILESHYNKQDISANEFYKNYYAEE